MVYTPTLGHQAPVVETMYEGRSRAGGCLSFTNVFLSAEIHGREEADTRVLRHRSPTTDKHLSFRVQQQSPIPPSPSRFAYYIQQSSLRKQAGRSLTAGSATDALRRSRAQRYRFSLYSGHLTGSCPWRAQNKRYSDKPRCK